MADNIKIIGNILNIDTISRYDVKDINLIKSQKIAENFGGEGDYIEFYTYDIAGNLLDINYDYLSYKLPTNIGLTPGTSTTTNTTGNIQTTDVGIESTLATPTSSLYPIIEIDPVKDLQDIGYSSGEFNIRYNIFHNKLSNFQDRALFVKEISQDRTEIRLASTTLTNDEIESTVTSIIDEINNSSYFVDYLLNFGVNEQYVAVNIALNKAPEGYEVLFKLYQPLPLNIQEKQTLWVVEEKTTPYVFDVNLDKLIIAAPAQQLRGPNFNIEIPNQSTVSTQYNTYSNLVTGLQSLQQTSYHQILNLLATQSANINIDYTNYNDFVFFGSAYQRLSNFYTKAQQIENYNTFITSNSPFTASKPSLITEINQYSSSVSNIISQFDGYESYLYFESSSYAWPKTSSSKPFSLLPTSSAIVVTWYNNLTSSAQNYDSNNYDNLEYAVPNFIKDDENNAPFLLFLNMIGHYFDNIWIYLGAVTDTNLANNNLNYGISRDLVYNQLQSLGIRLYNSQAGESVDQYLVGANTGSSIWDNNFTITGSYLNNIPRKDLVSELYKRIYHNLPLLLKTKGTVAGLDHLTTIFGITGSILNVKEFGGSLKSNLINGYNNDKVRIVSNDIVPGNTLSHELSLQTFPVSSSQFRDNDMNYVDISFSPQTQIDTYISGAIAKNNPSWSLDDYIGDPRQQYSGSYPDLDNQRQLYYQTGVSGYSGFTGSLMDYNGFIRLIQYFDNALFKMLNDFVPERTSLSTGVTFNSPVLERNKVSYANPSNTTTQSVYEGEISASTISSPYGIFYDALQGDKKPYFDGALSGSIVNVYQYFEDNYNPYLQPTGSVDQNQFAHSDWNVLLNNVSASVLSTKRKKIEYTGNFLPTGSLTSSAELQDSYLTLRSYNTSRYEGSTLTSLKYNTYTSASYTGSNGITVQNGDMSYGKTAVIDRNSYKVGWVKNIPAKSLNFFDKTTIQLKYLIDTEQQITDLSARNNNVIEVQNIFKSGDPVVLSLSDANKPSKQKSLDGTKTIFRGGYSFDPILYRENGENLTFLYTDYYITSLIYKGLKKYSSQFNKLYTKTKGTGYVSTNIWSEWARANYGDVDTIFQPSYESVLPDITGTIGIVVYDGTYLPTQILNPIGGRIAAPEKWNYNDWLSNITSANNNVPALNVSNFNFSIPGGQVDPAYTTFTGISLPFIQSFQNVWRFDIGQYFTNDISSSFDSNNFTEDVQPNNTIFVAPSDGTYAFNATFRVSFEGSYENETSIIDPGQPDQPSYTSFEKARRRPYISGSNMKLVCILEKQAFNTSTWTFLANTKIESIGESTQGTIFSNNVIHFPAGQAIVKANDITMKIVNSDGSFGPATFDLLADDKLRFGLYFIDIGGIFSIWKKVNNLSIGGKTRALIGTDALTVTDNIENYNSFEISNTSDASYTYIQTTSVTSSVNTFDFYQNTNNNIFISDSSLAALFYTSSTFTPSTSSATYENYSPVIDTLSVQPNDLIRFGKFNAPNQRYYIVTNSYPVTTNTYSRNRLYQTFKNITFTKDDPISTRLGNNTLRSTIKIPTTGIPQNSNALTFFNNILSNGGYFIVENTSINNLNINKIFLINQIYQFTTSGDVFIFINDSTFSNYTPTSTTETTKFTLMTATPIDTYVITTDKNIDITGINYKRDFAILRPKPDETSVIVNYKKPEGEVSQTILIPQDASDLLKSKVGDIFNNFNTNLSDNQTVA